MVAEIATGQLQFSQEPHEGHLKDATSSKEIIDKFSLPSLSLQRPFAGNPDFTLYISHT